MEEWENMWGNGLKFTLCTNLKENFYKMMYRWHMSPCKLSRIYKGVSGKRWKCEDQEGMFYHLW